MNLQAEPLPTYLEALNDQQLKGTLHFEGPILILAGAGSGKTRVLTHRIAHLIDYYGVSPSSILAVTFTNKAAEEMKRRLSGLLGERGERVQASTFHSFGLKVLRRHASLLGYTSDFVVYDAQDSKTLLKEISEELRIDENRFPVQYLQRAIENAKNKSILPEKFSDHFADYAESIVGSVYDRYQRELLKNNAMDFNDLLLNTVLLLTQHAEVLARYQRDIQFVLVDEFQDTNDLQYKLIRLLAAPQNNLLVVGDDDQSIYAFRGATIENILHFERDFKQAKVIALEQNYRSTQTILDSANAVIAKNPERRAKTLWTDGEQGSKLRGYVGFDENDEAHFIAREISSLHRQGHRLSDVAIFYRTNAQSRALEDALVSQGLPYRIFGGLKFYDRKEIKDVLAYLKLVVNEKDNQALQRCINTPPRGIGPKSVEDLRQLAVEHSCSMYEAARRFGGKSKAIHAFTDLIEEIKAQVEKTPLYELVGLIIDRTGYVTKLKATKDITALSRVENLDELRNIALRMSYQGETPSHDLRMFLDKVSLTSQEELPVEEAGQMGDVEPPDAVSLMTLHLAKGLEFPYVFLTGLEEGTLPHYRSLESEFELSEERRLCYVGMTRAMEKLYLTRAERRGMFGREGGFNGGYSEREPSRFLFDIPEGCFDADSRHVANSFSRAQRMHYEYRDELTFEQVKSRKGEAQKGSSMKARRASSAPVVFSADDLEGRGGANSEFAKYPPAKLQDMNEGTAVIHSIFGRGTVLSVSEIDTGDPERAKITVRFENFELPKKLVFRHAKLGLIQ